MRHEKYAKFFHVHTKIEVFTFHGKIKIIFTDKYFNILLSILTVTDTRTGLCSSRFSFWYKVPTLSILGFQLMS